MREELFINDIKVDLSEESGIYLVYKSNILGDIASINSNHSYTINLPRTQNNMRAIGIINVTTETTMPYRTHRGRLLRDGIVVVDDANVRITSVDGEKICLSLSFGVGAKVKKLITDDRQLNELDYTLGSTDDYIEWHRRLYGATTAVADYGFKSGEQDAWYHPAVPVGYVLDKIEQTYGISIEGRTDQLNRWRIPLLTRKGERKYAQANVYQQSVISATDLMQFTVDEETVFLKPFALTEFETPNISVYKSSEWRVKAKKLSTVLNMTGEIYVTSDTLNLELLVIGRVGEESYVRAGIAPAEIMTSESGYVYRFTLDDMQTEETTMLAENLYIGIGGGSQPLISTVLGTLSLTAWQNTVHVYEMGVENEQRVSNEGEYYYVPNLPNIKVMEFLKAITQMAGLYVTTDGDAIKLNSYNNLSTDGAQDWTGKRQGEMLQTFKVEGWAQKNWFRYKESSRFDGAIKIDDDTLSWDKEMVKLPFSNPVVNMNNEVRLGVYSYNDDGELEINDVSDVYIVNAYTDGYRYYLTAEGMQWMSLFSNYTTLMQILDGARLVEAEYNLSAMDLKELDMNGTVYDDGCYYAIVEVKTKKGFSTVKLMKL